MTDSDRTTPERNKIAKVFIAIHRSAMSLPESDAVLQHQWITYNAVLEALEPRQREVYEFVMDCTTPITSSDVEDLFDMSQEAASINLKSLVELGMLKRARAYDPVDNKVWWYEYEGI